VILGLDTATGSTAVAVLLDDGRVFEARDDPSPGERPQHAARVLELAEEVLGRAGATWTDVTRLAVGLGPGGFTGLRIGIATARGLAQANGIPLAGVSTLDALAAPHRGASVLAVLDARRGEAFTAGYSPDGSRLLAPAALAPEALAGAVASLPGPVRAVGDGAIRFRAHLEGAGAAVPPDEDPVHRVSAVQVCRLGADAPPTDRDALLPEYVREPDAKPPARP
jgi:tRNA threonylcarbamoyladenosine biosynthesis protein TsaB